MNDELQKVTPAQIEAEIVSEYSTTLDKAYAGAPLVEGLERVTVHTIALRNGAKLVGVNYGAIVPSNHSEEEGRKQARSAAFDQAWQLFGFRLRDRIAANALTEADSLADVAGTPRPDHPAAA